jgi:hypothetical protein
MKFAVTLETKLTVMATVEVDARSTTEAKRLGRQTMDKVYLETSHTIVEKVGEVIEISTERVINWDVLSADPGPAERI